MTRLQAAQGPHQPSQSKVLELEEENARLRHEIQRLRAQVDMLSGGGPGTSNHRASTPMALMDDNDPFGDRMKKRKMSSDMEVFLASASVPSPLPFWCRKWHSSRFLAFASRSLFPRQHWAP